MKTLHTLALAGLLGGLMSASLIQAQQPSAGVVTAAINYTKVNAGRERLAFPFTVPKGYKRLK